MANPKPDQRPTLAFSPIIPVDEYLPGSQEMTSPAETAPVEPTIAKIPGHPRKSLERPPGLWSRPEPEETQMAGSDGLWQPRNASSPESEEKTPQFEHLQIDIETAKIPSNKPKSHVSLSPSPSPELASSDSTDPTPAPAMSRAARKKANKKKNAAAAKADLEAEEAALAAGKALADQERHMNKMNEMQNAAYLASDECKEGAKRLYERIMGHPRKEVTNKEMTTKKNEVEKITVHELGIAPLPPPLPSIESEEPVPRFPVTVLATLSKRLSSGSLGLQRTHEALVVLMKAPPLEQLGSIRSLILTAARLIREVDQSDAKELGVLASACLEFKEQLMQWMRKRYQAGIEPHVWQEQLALETTFRKEAAKFMVEVAEV